MYTCIIPSYPLIPMDFCPSFPLQVWSPPRLSWRWPQISPARRWISRVDFRNLELLMENLWQIYVCMAISRANLWHIYGKFMKSGRNVISRKSLIGGSTDVLFFHILGMSSSQLTNSYFSEGLKPPTRWQIYGTYVRKYGQILPKNMGSLWEMHQWKLVMNVPPSLFTGGYMFFCCFFPRNSRDLSNTTLRCHLQNIGIEALTPKNCRWKLTREKRI